MTDKKTEVKKIFDSIAWRYDFLNHLLSFGMDIYWRKKAIKLTGLDSNSILLDVACGTGDVAIEARKQGARTIYGADYSFNMLQLFEKKSEWIKSKTVQMAAEKLPLKDESVTKNSLGDSIFKEIDFSDSGINLSLRAEQLNLKDFERLTLYTLNYPSLNAGR